MAPNRPPSITTPGSPFKKLQCKMQLTALLHKREQIVQELFAFGVIIDFIELKREEEI